jgi:signal transduction histidine kinase
MRREIRIYLLIVVLPAILLVAGGIRLISLESARAHAAAVKDLDAKARAVARTMIKRLRQEGVPPHPPHPPPHAGKAPHGWRMKSAPETCPRHDLPPRVREVLAAVLKPGDGTRGKPELVEVRHACGCVAVAGEKPIVGSLVGHASLRPVLSDYFVCCAYEDGDAAVALGVRATAGLVGILVLLLCATLAAGVALLMRAARVAREEARQKTDFLSNVSHELKTPLTSIALFAEMLASGTLDRPSADKAAETIRKEAKRLGGLIDGLLEYARLERGTRAYALETFPLKPLVDEAVAAFAPSFPNGLSLSCDESYVLGDREATRRILDCLLENAAKYAGAAGAVSIEVAGARVRVCDCGPGLSAQDARHVFERFWRADNSVTRTTGGTGLGLAIARELAHGMGAELSLAPNTPHGCVFTLALRTEKKSDG